MFAFILPALAQVDDVTLHVAVHRDAGSIFSIAADGTAGQCRVLGMSRITCPAAGPVTFRWGLDNGFVLHGDVTVRPGEIGTGFVLPPNGAREEERRRLEEPTVLDVQTVFLRTGARPIAAPSPDLFRDLLLLTRHESWLIRREAIRGLTPYVRHTASDPFPPDAPSLLPVGLFEQLASDPHKQVRRRAARLLRELEQTDPRAAEAEAVIRQLQDDGDRRVRKLATVARTAYVAERMVDPLDAWQQALSRVSQAGPPGRAACNAIAQLHDYLPSGSVDADRALGLVIQHHPEKAWRVWNAWRDELPFHRDRVLYLLSRTIGLSRGLLRKWAAENPVELAAVLSDWEPGAPHSRRFEVVAAWLSDRMEEPILERVLTWDDSLSALPPPPPEQ